MIASCCLGHLSRSWRAMGGSSHSESNIKRQVSLKLHQTLCVSMVFCSCTCLE
uniref:Uncharacterized protein n=1 Tax=Anguilla anguilla TaxID=7936 RepID=A0A0E9WJR6_ANGAN